MCPFFNYDSNNFGTDNYFAEFSASAPCPINTDYWYNSDDELCSICSNMVPNAFVCHSDDVTIYSDVCYGTFGDYEGKLFVPATYDLCTENYDKWYLEDAFGASYDIQSYL